MRRYEILIVDDEEKIIKALEKVLRKEPYNIHSTTDPLKVMKILGHNDIDIVILDLKMPKLNGIELLRKIRSKFPHILNIVLTGYADVETSISAINVEKVYKLLRKPWDNEELKSILHRAAKEIDLIRSSRRLLERVEERVDKRDWIPGGHFHPSVTST